MRTIKSRGDFERVFSRGRRQSDALLRIRVMTCDEGHPGRVAFVAAKRLGNAVYRNRCKRILREAAREVGLPLEGHDVILLSTPATHDSSPKQVAGALGRLLKRAGV
ncbi:ribonuclease P protein component [Thermophilibacter sp.]